MSILRCTTTGVVLALMGIGSVQAGLIGVTDNGGYFEEAGAGLDWLDVTTSANRSYDDVSAQFGAGGDFEGWRFATSAEFGGMLSVVTHGNYSGISTFSQNVTRESAADIRTLVGMFGDTVDNNTHATVGQHFCDTPYAGCTSLGDIVYTRGFLAEQYALNTQYQWAGRIEDDDRQTYSADLVGTDTIELRSGYARPYLGSFLVRSTASMSPTPPVSVPEPASLALMGLGLAGLAFSRRRRKLQA